MIGEYKEIDEEKLKVAFKTAYPVQCMAAHGAEDSAITYIGSTRRGNLITDYFQATGGSYWYENRGIRDGKIVSMDVYIFGHEVKKGKKKS